ncbi:hypothetical protein L2U69_00570 [Zavarzinia compransoris]|uniref:dienelactone hydrolase family protein n=1 Tax=Zavarzinia marina TaxID=2911065 RepID=UPI001F404F82|nr:hypothetical protein [Zavarzinia marina]MCF4164136.1 hypothetical protein [Zavarzinia marina]
MALSLAACDLADPVEDAVWAKTVIAVPWSATADGRGIEATVGELVAEGGTRGDPLAGRLAVGGRWPVVVFLHGCSGDMAGVPARFAERGFIVVAPWSFARPGRPASCGDVGPETLRWRLEETRWTLARLRGLPWVDPWGIAVVGASEGGLAAAQFADAPDEVVALAIMGWTCTDRNNVDFDGVRVPADRAVHAVIGLEDPLVADARVGGDCRVALRDRDHAVGRVVQGLGHAVPPPAILDEIAGFIADARRRHAAVIAKP